MFFMGTDRAEKVLEGCPCIDLPDKAEDMRRFLNCIYKRDYYQPGKFAEYRVIESLLRISTKFLVQPLRRELAEHLKGLYPSTLQEFRDGHEKNHAIFNQKAPYHSLLTVNMAREFDIPIILPAALYYCCELEPQQDNAKITDGMKDNNGNLTKLCHSNQLLCLTAQRRMAVNSIPRLNGFLVSLQVARTCSDPKMCHREIPVLLKYAVMRLGEINFFTEVTFQHEFSDSLCTACNTEWIIKEEDGYNEAWMGLPAMFDLPSWDELAILTENAL